MPPIPISDKAKPSDVIAYFGPDCNGKMLTGGAIIQFKNADADGYDAIARGIKNGSFTY